MKTTPVINWTSNAFIVLESCDLVVYEQLVLIGCESLEHRQPVHEILCASIATAPGRACM